MKMTGLLWVAASAACLVGAAVVAQEAKAGNRHESFDAAKAGALPEKWRATTKLLMKGEIAEASHVWQVQADPAAPSKPNVLGVVKVSDPRGYSVCWTDAVSFKDGTVTAKGRVNSAKLDGSCGLAWRVVDAGNFYVARYNSLEKNFRVYVFKDGKRAKLAEAAGIAIENGTWFTIKVVAKGDKFECMLNDLKPLVFTDATCTAGGVGFYVKQDGLCSFDDLDVSGE